ncbi:hypothetical protein J2Y55_004558 [Bosea sp. BE125]|uniref:hypothetical protein n=1 Tax=Bosea sp. BE125 TaxID=2817909 RepID=UPI002858250B|nr:hypothetical protein [Bosea sp. BE125]MDR6873531.1 hypothetical protein [Bosea sp. BE125]
MSVVPLVPLRRVDDLIERLEAVKADADKRGFGTLAYFLETALIEARIQHRGLEDEKAASAADPRDLWRPET